MADTPLHGKSFSEAELSAMRREVLAWIERDRQRLKPAPGKPLAPATVTPRRPKRMTHPKKISAPMATVTPTPPKKAAPPAPKLVIPRLPLALPPGRSKKEVTPPPRPGRAVKRRERIPLLAALVSAAVASMLLTLVLVGAYRWRWNNWAVVSLARVLPLPAVRADGRVYWLDDFLLDVGMLQRASVRAGRPQGDDQLRRQAFTRFIGQVAIERLAAQYQVQVGTAELDAQLQRLIQQSGSRAQFQQSIQENFSGWSVDDFSERLLRPYLQEVAVRAKLWEDPRAWEAAAVRLKFIRQSLQEGSRTFAQAAAMVNRDDSRAVGGDLGYRARGDLEAEIFAAAEKISDGEISQPLRTGGGYVLLLREEAVGEGGDLRLRLRMITVTPADYFEQRMGEILREMSIRRYVP